MIKAVVFDLDGVLVDADEWHWQALNLALRDHDLPEISWQEHLSIYKGRPTREKLATYRQRHFREMDRLGYTEMPKTVPYQKQWWTKHMIEGRCQPRPEIVAMFDHLRGLGYKIAVASNAVRATVDSMLERSGLTADLTLSNEDVDHPKPSPDIYLKAFDALGARPEECVIVEDSAVGIQAADASGAWVLGVSGPGEVNVWRVLGLIKSRDTVNLVIPAAGRGARFAEAGYLYPKPLIPVKGKPMLRAVLDNLSDLGPDLHPTVIAQRDHIDRYGMARLFPEATIVRLSGVTQGAADTVLQADRWIGPRELVIANSDQIVDELGGFLRTCRRLDADAGIVVFAADDPKWSYAKIGEDGFVTEVAEKKPISPWATAGIYWYRNGTEFVRYARQMIAKDIRVNGEFYVAPVFNEMIADGKRVLAYSVTESSMHGLGTPEDLEAYQCATVL